MSLITYNRVIKVGEVVAIKQFYYIQITRFNLQEIFKTAKILINFIVTRRLFFLSTYYNLDTINC